MADRRAPIIAALAAGLVGVLASPARPCAVNIDASESMRGFKGSPTFATILATLGSTCDEHFRFGLTTQRAPPDLGGLEFGERDTALGPSLKTWLGLTRARRLLILTDNVADVGSGRGETAQTEFYDLLRSPGAGFKSIAAVILRVPFNGPVYSPDNRRTGYYHGGSRALMIYLMDRDGPPGPPEPSLDVSALGVTPDQMTVIALKPFEAAAQGRSPTISSDQRDVSLEDGAVTLARRSAGETYRFTLTAEVTPSPRWNFAGSAISARLRFPADRLFGPERVTPCSTEPATAPGGTGPYAIKVMCAAPSALSGLDDAHVRQLGNRRADRLGTLDVQLLAKSQSIALGPELRRWSFDGDGARLATGDPSVQGSIYRLGQLLAGMSPATVSPTLFSIPVVEKLYFFALEPILTGLIVALAAGLVGAVVWMLAGPVTVVISGGAGGTVTRTVRFAGRIEAPIDALERATIWVLPGLFLVQATIPRFRVLGGRGGQVTLGRAGRRLSIRAEPARNGRGFARATAAPRRRR